MQSGLWYDKKDARVYGGVCTADKAGEASLFQTVVAFKREIWRNLT